jgi:hypothetical protein
MMSSSILGSMAGNPQAAQEADHGRADFARVIPQQHSGEPICSQTQPNANCTPVQCSFVAPETDLPIHGGVGR